MVSNRFKSNRTLSGKIQRITARVDRTEKKASAAAAISENAVDSVALAAESVGSPALAPHSVNTNHLGIINQIISDYNLDLIVGVGGFVTLRGGGYDVTQNSLLGYEDGNIVQAELPMRYATVATGYTSGQAQVVFEGESGLSGPYRYTSAYTPVAGDRVVLLNDYDGSYVISGKLLP